MSILLSGFTSLNILLTIVIIFTYIKTQHFHTSHSHFVVVPFSTASLQWQQFI
jgi:hypothetical protein